MMKNATVKMLSGLGLSLLMSGVYAGTITDIKVSSLNQNQKVVKIQFQGGVTQPQGFTSNQPPRVALDFAGTSLQVPQNVLQFNDPLLQNISVASENGRARVVMALNKQGQYRVEQRGDSLLVHLDATGAAPTASPAPAVSPAPVAAPAGRRYAPVNVAVQQERNRAAIAQFHDDGAPVKSGKDVAMDMRFSRNAQKNAGVMHFTLPHNHPEPKVERSGNDLVLTFANMPLAYSAQKNYDVADFNTPVRKVEMKRVGKNTKVIIRTNSTMWDYDAKSQNGAYIVSVTDQTSLFNSLDERPKAKKFTGGRVTLDFQDVEVRTILQILAKESGVNIVASDSVQGKMTLNLKDVPWDQALDLVMQARNLDMRRQGNIINIAPRDELLKQETAIAEGHKKLTENGPLMSRTFQLKYKSVEDFKEILKSGEDTKGNGSSNTNTFLTERGSVLFDPGTNTLIVTDIQSVLNKFDKLITQLDVPVRQVMVEARIVEVSDSFSREMGVRWGFMRGSSSYYDTNGLRGTTMMGGMIADGDKISMRPGDTFGTPNVNLNVTAPTTALTIARVNASGLIGLELSAMQEKGLGKIVSSPRVLTQDRQEASLEEGQDVPYQESTSSGATSTTFKKAVTGLTVTPQITPDGNVIMKLKINKDEVDTRYNDGRMNVKRVETTAMVENGGTIVIGGIYVEKDSNGVASVPLLGDIPILGNLFKHSSRNKERRELLIFITPRILDTVGGNLDY